ncbi:PLP-dependent aminotransferase family protein [Solihabitans fulvus]|uniref:PLP-dependent aminotransferase family protein n=1 Tax=Solihabitans fulvus TaxID=1892852 RepID=A0A5B2WYR1_9PSEU|nr:PLP-dependent aminotransferase family protein [Solihabitans fulvus]KAA2256725.1 PLP-dependent aminotransferase family protein [Solihabitans fulvus]
MEDYHLIADALAADIAAGRLRPGDRLAPQRQFAKRRGIASSTAARVYGELIRRGLAVGEVGRGTFVRAAKPPPEPALAEPGGARIDLELNFAVLPDQPELLARSLARMLRSDTLAASLRPSVAVGTPAAREASAALLARAGWMPEPSRIVFTGNGRQAIAAAIAALVPVGERLGVEELTYPVVKAIASRLGVTLVPLPMDADGLTPDGLRAAHRAAPLRAVYLQPTLHNPLGTTMSAARRAELAETLRELDLPAIEDTIYSFLRAEAPLAALAPERTVLVDSLSKRLAPGLTLGFAVTPPALTGRVATAIRSGTWTAGRFALDAATGWLQDGTAAAVESAKRRDAAARQEIARERLAGFAVRADPAAYHLWWELPEPWRAETFLAAAARHGIALTPAASFAVGSGRAPNAVRLALSAPPPDALASALDVLAGLARGLPEDAEPDG